MTEAKATSPGEPGARGEYRLRPADFADLDQLILFCWEALRAAVFRHGFGQHEGAIRLALHEAFCNAYRHGNRQDRQAPIFFAWHFAGPELTCRLRDSGAGFDCHLLPDPTSPTNCGKDHGRGLFIIRHLAQRVSWQEGGRQVTMVFNREPQQPGKAGSGQD